jgi:DNA-binding IclR family transcriptional regulator
MTKSEPITSSAGTQTLERGLDLIERVVDRPMNLAELAASSGLHLSATRRLVAGLVSHGFLQAGQNGRLQGGPKLIQLGVRAQGQLNFVDVAREHLGQLSADTGMPSFLGERDHDYSVHLHRAAGRQRVVVTTPVGTRRKLPETSLGKALLLDDPEAEWQRLFGEAAPEFRPGRWREQMLQGRVNGVIVHASPPPDNLRAIAAPVRDASGRIVAAISVVTPQQYLPDNLVDEFASLVRATAAAISTALGFVPPPDQAISA